MTARMLLRTDVLQCGEIRGLRAANEKQVQRKNVKSTKQPSHQGGLTSDTVADVSGGGADQIYIRI